MRTIDRSTRFKRDYKRESKGRHRATLDADLLPVLAALATDTPLDPKYRDLDLSGAWAGYRDCHVKPDLVLIYAQPDDETLRLARLGSYSEVFGQMMHMRAIFIRTDVHTSELQSLMRLLNVVICTNKNT